MRTLVLVLVLSLLTSSTAACKMRKRSEEIRQAQATAGSGAQCLHHNPKGADLTICATDELLVICDDRDGCIRIPLRGGR